MSPEFTLWVLGYPGASAFSSEERPGSGRLRLPHLAISRSGAALRMQGNGRDRALKVTMGEGLAGIGRPRVQKTTGVAMRTPGR